MAYDPASADLRVWRNGDYVEEFTIAERFEADGTPVNRIDLTGYSAEMQVRQYGLAGGDPLIDLETVTDDAEGLRFMEPAQGVLRVRIDKATLEALPNTGKAGFERRFAYDLVLIAPTGDRSVYASGAFIVPPGVTR